MALGAPSRARKRRNLAPSALLLRSRVQAANRNAVAARFSGVNTRLITFSVLTVMGAAAGLAGMLYAGRLHSGLFGSGQDDNLSVIAAVILGGTSLFGGRGAVLGTLIGALIVGVIRNGLQLMGVSSIYQILITGVLVILAVSIDQISRKRAS